MGAAQGGSEGGLWSPWQGLAINKMRDWALDGCGLKETFVPGRGPRVSKDVEEDRARLAEEGTVEGRGLAERDCEGVGRGALFYGFGLGNEVPGIVGLAPAWPRNRYETVAAEI